MNDQREWLIEPKSLADRDPWVRIRMRKRGIRVWLVGQRSFAVACLRSFLEHPTAIEVVGVSTTPLDKLWHEAVDQGIRHCSAKPTLAVPADVIVNAHGYARIPAEAIEACQFGAIGYHPSLLPRHRGRSAVEWTIAHKDPIAGGTVYQLDCDWDTGPIIAQDWTHVDPAWGASELWRESLFPMGVCLLTEVLCNAGRGPEYWPTRPGEPQDETYATREVAVER